MLPLPFERIDFFEKECQRLLSNSSFGFKEILLLLFELENCSLVCLVFVSVVTIVTPNVGRLKSLLEDLYILVVTDFKISTCSVAVLLTV
jgi:hypothetical protein